MQAKEDKQKTYIDYLIKELYLRRDLFNYQEVKSIYIGGGSPSSLSYFNLRRLLENISKVINLNGLIEFTIECNPIDVNEELASLFSLFHVNRVSLGVQSLDNNKLMFLNRSHRREDVFKAIEILNQHNIYNINCDLIYGLENDNIFLIKNEIDELLNHDVRHLSLYTLIIENKTILKRFIEKGYKPLSDEKEREIYDFVNSYLKTKNFIHYETSNYSYDNYQSIHNCIYWDNENFYGLGANASYYVDDTYYTNPNTLTKYYKSIDNYPIYDYKECEKYSLKDKMYNEIMLGLRKIKGISVNKFYQKFKMNIFDVFPKISSLIKSNIMSYEDDNLFVNEDYSYLLNTIIVKIIEE